MGCLLYFFSLGTWGAVYAYGTELYPTEARGSGVGWAAAFGRVGAMTAPFVVGLIYQSYGKVSGYRSFLACSQESLSVALSVLILGVETKGKTLDELTRGKIETARAT